MDWLGVWPGRRPGGDDTRGSAEPGGRGGTVYQYSGSCSLLLYLRVESVATWSLNFNIENFTKGMAIRVQLVNTANPDGVEFRFEDSEPAQTLDNGGFWIPDEKLTDYGYSVGLRLQMNSSKGCEAGYTVKCTARKT